MKKLALVLALLAAGGCGTSPKAGPASPKDAVTETSSPTTSAGRTPGGKPPFTGTYRLESGSDGQQTFDLTAVFAKGGVVGEMIVQLEADSVAIGVWTFGPDAQTKPAKGRAFKLCRVHAILEPTWEGKTFTLPFKVKVVGRSEEVVLDKTKANGATKRNVTQDAMDCNMSLDPGPYTFEGSGEEPAEARMVTAKGTFVLKRTSPIGEVKGKAALEAYEAAFPSN